jgi:menaquinone-dependent protoporphyrinogen IX oxidase
MSLSVSVEKGKKTKSNLIVKNYVGNWIQKFKFAGGKFKNDKGLFITVKNNNYRYNQNVLMKKDGAGISQKWKVEYLDEAKTQGVLKN